MFKKKVGSDACLVLDCEITLASTTATFTIQQKFDYADILEASKTRSVTLRAYTSNATLAALFGNSGGMPVVAFDNTNSRFKAVGYIPGDSDSIILFTFSQNATTKVWSATISLA